MTSGRPTSTGPLFAASVALVAIAVGGVTDIFTGALPEHWRWATGDCGVSSSSSSAESPSGSR